ncbi:MAG: hydroxymyristoyl-ACP dehydratase [Rubrivivax sp.]|nr:hydroxymyristoyl-ACP dehydratase [Rubrivivax sp.]
MTAAAAPGAPATLDHAGIAARVPHAGAMCLLEQLLRWDTEAVECRVTSHADPAHPLRDRDADGTDHGLPGACAIEYASQAMALHASLASARGGAAAPTPGFLASARDVRLHAERLDTAAGPLVVAAWRLAGDEHQALYRFELCDAAGDLLVEGRTTVVLNSPLPLPAAPGPA